MSALGKPWARPCRLDENGGGSQITYPRCHNCPCRKIYTATWCLYQCCRSTQAWRYPSTCHSQYQMDWLRACNRRQCRRISKRCWRNPCSWRFWQQRNRRNDWCDPICAGKQYSFPWSVSWYAASNCGICQKCSWFQWCTQHWAKLQYNAPCYCTDARSKWGWGHRRYPAPWDLWMPSRSFLKGVQALWQWIDSRTSLWSQ